MASGTIFPPGQTPESPEARDARVALENAERDAKRQFDLAKAEYRNALRVHGYDRDIDAEVERAFSTPAAPAVPVADDKPAGE